MLVQHLDPLLVLAPHPKLGGDEGQQVTAVFGLGQRLGDHLWRAVPGGLAHRLQTVEGPGGDVGAGVAVHRPMDGGVDVLPAAGPLPVEKGRHDRRIRLAADDMAGVPHLRRHRRRVVLALGRGIVAGDHHDAAHRQVHQVGALPIAVGAGLSEGRDRRHHQARVDLLQRLVSKAQAVEVTRRVALQQNVGLRDEASQPLLPFRRGDVENDAPLAEVVVPEVEASLRVFHVLVEGADPARRAPLGRLDLDDVRAGAGQELAAELGLLVRQLQHPYVSEEALSHASASACAGYISKRRLILAKSKLATSSTPIENTAPSSAGLSVTGSGIWSSADATL